uniref:Kelch domain containing 7B n=1 Tax=Equus caballus TaxID=9796 RepID=F6TUY2_HORSE
MASGRALGQQYGTATPEAPQGKGREPFRPCAALLDRKKLGGTPAPLLIHFTSRSPGREVEMQVEAGGVRAKVPAHQGPVHTEKQDTSPWQRGVGTHGSLGRGPGSRRWQVDNSSGDRTCQPTKLDPLCLATVVSVWDTVDAASSLSASSQRPLLPEELPPSHTLQTRPITGGSEVGPGEKGPLIAPGLAVDSGAKGAESRESGPQAPKESQGSPASVEGWPWARKEVLVTRSFSQAPGSMGPWLEEPQWGRPLFSPACKPASAAALQWRLGLGSCLDVLAFAQQHGERGLAQDAYALMSDNLLQVLGDPNLYRRLSGADRERILSLRTGRGQAVLGVLVLPSLYQLSRSGLTRGPRGEEAPEAGSVPLLPRMHLHMFNPQENRWRRLTQVPEEAPLRGCALCTMHNYLFLAGGIRGSGTKAVCSNEVFCYNPLTNIWSQVQPMQQARAQLKLVALDGLLYAIGGECLYSMECYDPRTDAWTSCAPLPAGTFPVAHEAVACRGDIYVTGGHLFYRLLRYSPVKDSWNECPYSASHRRSSDMVALGGFLYRFDLLRGVGAAVMRYNTVTGSWSQAASLPLPDPAPLRCTVLGNTIYCLNHQVTATFMVSEGTAQFQAKELQPFPLGSKGVLCPFVLTVPPADPLQSAL